MVAINTDKILSKEEIDDLFIVDAEAGLLRWRHRGPGRLLSKPVGCLVGAGYRKVGLRPSGKKYIQFYVHHIIWTHYHGEWPKHGIDHVNGVKDDNRISNLRDATSRENIVNVGPKVTNTSGYKWVSPHKNRWQAAVWFGEERRQKYFKTKEDAYQWACEQAKELHGEFYNAGG